MQYSSRPPVRSDAPWIARLHLPVLLGIPLVLGALAPLFGIALRVRILTILAVTILATVAAAWLWALVTFRPRKMPGGFWRLGAPPGSLTIRMAVAVADDRRRWLTGAALFTAALLSLDIYSNYKQAIPRFGTFDWDPLLSDLDHAFHLGHYPWAVLAPLLEYEPVVRFVDRVYWTWYHVTIGTVAVVAWSRSRAFHIRAFLTFYGTWILGGIVMATALASGGPVYFAHFAPHIPDPYGALLARLNEMSLMAVEGHRMLWTGFTTGGDPWVSGISAMPSLHVAMAVFTVLVARAHGRIWFWLALAYSLVILLGSVLLGWHYAIDGYVSIALVLLLWWLAGRFLDRLQRKGGGVL